MSYLRNELGEWVRFFKIALTRHLGLFGQAGARWKALCVSRMKKA
jgi:hypothetical protein